MMPDPKDIVRRAAAGPVDWAAYSALREALRPLREQARRALSEVRTGAGPQAERDLATRLLADLFPPYPER